MTSKLVGLLSWYDEAPAWLAATVSSFGRHLDHLVAVDGPYMAYPHGGVARSGPDQAEVIQRTCDAMGIGLTLYQPTEPFFGNEVEKRTLAFRLAQLVTDTCDWIWVFDADEVLTHAPADLRTRLDCIESDVIEVTLTQHDAYDESGEANLAMNLQPRSQHDLRMIFRALPDLRVEGNHYTYLAGPVDDPVYLWGTDNLPLERSTRIAGVQVEHRTHRRTAHRRAASHDYYRTRDALALERAGVRMMETPDGRMEVVA